MGEGQGYGSDLSDERWALRRQSDIPLLPVKAVISKVARAESIAPLFEAVGEWRERGVVVDLRPRALVFVPMIVVNAVLFVAIFGLVAFFGARGDIGFVIQGIGVGALALFGIGVIAQFVPIAYLEWRYGPEQRRALLAMLRETLGP